MKINSINSNILLYAVIAALWLPLPSHAELVLPYWLSPTWIQLKLSDFHARNLVRYENTQPKSTATPTDSSQTDAQQNAPDTTIQQSTPKSIPASQNTTNNKAPVETAKPKINEKYLTPEELKELRLQLKQQQQR